MGLSKQICGFLARFIRVAESDGIGLLRPARLGAGEWQMATWQMANARARGGVEAKAPEKTGALQKLRRFVATWRGAGPRMDGNSYGINWLLTDSLRVESITALSSPS